MPSAAPHSTDRRREQRLQLLQADHRAAVDEFIARAAACPEPRWLTPRAEGKWTPAQEARHLILAYDAFTANLRGERHIPLSGTPAQRMVWRAVGLTSILWFRRIPAAVRAPRGVRPEWEATPRAELLTLLRASTERFITVFEDAWHTQPARRVDHPFFGALNLDQALRLMAVHTRHHAAFLPRPPR